jgi:hypothetical protein
MGHRPQTLYGIADSPVGLAAWFLDHDILSYEMIARAFDGKAERLTPDDVLDNITVTWLTNTAISSARLYWEALPPTSSGFGIERNNVHFFEPIGVRVPIAVPSPRSSTRRREAGRNAPIRSSFTTTGYPKAATSPRSGRCAGSGSRTTPSWRRPRSHYAEREDRRVLREHGTEASFCGVLCSLRVSAQIEFTAKLARFAEPKNLSQRLNSL